MSKVTIEVDVGELEWVEAPMVYSTPIGELNHINQVHVFERITDYIKRSKDDIVNMEHRNRKYFVTGLAEDFGRNIFKDNIELYYFIDAYDRWLMGFAKGTGYLIENAEFKYTVKCNGKKIKRVDGKALYLNERELVRVAIHNHISGISNSDFEYKIQ